MFCNNLTTNEEILFHYKGMMAMAGLTYGIIVTCSYSRAQNRALEAGYANDTNTNVMISGEKSFFHSKIMVRDISNFHVFFFNQTLDNIH